MRTAARSAHIDTLLYERDVTLILAKKYNCSGCARERARLSEEQDVGDVSQVQRGAVTLARPRCAAGRILT